MEGSPEENEGGGEETGFHPWPWNGDNPRMALNVASLSFNDCRYVSIRNRKKKYVTSHKMCGFMDAFSYEKATFKIS